MIAVICDSDGTCDEVTGAGGGELVAGGGGGAVVTGGGGGAATEIAPPSGMMLSGTTSPPPLGVRVHGDDRTDHRSEPNHERQDLDTQLEAAILAILLLPRHLLRL